MDRRWLAARNAGKIRQCAPCENHRGRNPRTWENIDLYYSYGNQKTSAKIELLSDHTVKNGIWSGSRWSFDKPSQTLTIGGVKLYLQRECDWESADRHATIVYAGYKGTSTYWGKKCP